MWTATRPTTQRDFSKRVAWPSKRSFSGEIICKCSKCYLDIWRACLFAEGDAVKHLSMIGLNIVYHQDPVDEINFKVFSWQLIFVTVFSSLASLRLSQSYILWFLCPMPLFIYHHHQFLSNQSQDQPRLVTLHLYQWVTNCQAYYFVETKRGHVFQDNHEVSSTSCQNSPSEETQYKLGPLNSSAFWYFDS
jgi:hypothetical protein